MYTYPFLIGMKLAGSEDIGIHIALCALTEVLVFLENLSIEFADVGELLVRSVLVAVNFILDLAGCGRGWDHALNIEEVVTSQMSVSTHLEMRIEYQLTCMSPMWSDSRMLLLV
jgi:hypothetical protein